MKHGGGGKVAVGEKWGGERRVDSSGACGVQRAAAAWKKLNTEGTENRVEGTESFGLSKHLARPKARRGATRRGESGGAPPHSILLVAGVAWPLLPNARDCYSGLALLSADCSGLSDLCQEASGS